MEVQGSDESTKAWAAMLGSTHEENLEARRKRGRHKKCGEENDNMTSKKRNRAMVLEWLGPVL